MCAVSTNRFEHNESLPPGTKIGEYVIQAVLGRGGMGTVYQATNLAIGSSVAVKVLSRDFTFSPKAVDRFFDEARIASRVRHPNIVQVFSFGRLDDGGYYFVMEYLDGQSLRSLLKRQRIPVEGVLTIVEAVADALDRVHAHGVIHRDLSPANIFIVEPDRPISPARIKLLDFGISKLLEPELFDGDNVQTSTGVNLGTPGYMSPEQCSGGVSSGQSDVYSLGVLTFEMLAGRRLYPARTAAEMLQMATAHDVAKVARREIRMGRGVGSVLARALATDPDRRFDSATTFAEALKEAILRWRAAGHSRSSRAVWIAASVLFVAAAVIGIGVALWRDVPRPSPRDLQRSERPIDGATPSAADDASSRPEGFTTRSSQDDGGQRAKPVPKRRHKRKRSPPLRKDVPWRF